MVKKSVVTAEAVALVKKLDSFADQIGKFRVKDDPSYRQAGEQLRHIKGKMLELDDLRKSMTRPLDTSKKAIMDFFRVPVARLVTIETSIKESMTAFAVYKEAKRLAAEKKLKEKYQKLLEKAEAATEAGEDKKADKLEKKAEELPAVIQSMTPKLAGVKYRTAWKFRVVDVKKVPRKYMLVDEKTIGGIARDRKGAVEIPGVEFYSEEILQVSV